MLIKTHQASIITSAADLVYHLGWDLDEIQKPNLPSQVVTPLDGEEKILYNFLKDKDKVLLDTIAVGCAMPTYKVAQLLLKLEMKSLVRPLPGKLFQWI
jgi:DNA processing protein